MWGDINKPFWNEASNIFGENLKSEILEVYGRGLMGKQRPGVEVLTSDDVPIPVFSALLCLADTEYGSISLSKDNVTTLWLDMHALVRLEKYLAVRLEAYKAKCRKGAGTLQVQGAVFASDLGI